MELFIDHVQVAAPAGCEPAARAFYGTLLGLVELAKPKELRDGGGCWFQCGPAQLHVGVDPTFQPARKAHPAFGVRSVEPLRTKLLAHGYKVIDDLSLPEIPRFFSEDPWGNRIEFVQRPRTAAP